MIGGDNLCPKHHTSYKRAWVVAPRTGAIASLIDSYKFQRAQAASVVLAELLDSRLPALPQNTILVPIPATPNSLRVRGYDHVSLICRSLASARGWEVGDALKRNNNITQHFTKSAAERRRQAESFFRIRKVASVDAPHLIIDDILTTGATVGAAAKCLAEAGIGSVWVAVLAKQVNSHPLSRVAVV